GLPDRRKFNRSDLPDQPQLPAQHVPAREVDDQHEHDEHERGAPRLILQLLYGCSASRYTTSGSAFIDDVGSNFRNWLPNAVNRSGAVSPAARATDRSAPVITPAVAAGTISWSDTRQRGSPSARPDSRRPGGMRRTALSVVRITIGSISTASAIAPENAEK